MKNLIKMMVEQALDELMEPQEPTVYFDMDGVLADFDKKAHSFEHVAKAKKALEAFKSQKPEIAKLHNDELKELLRGRQEDPWLAKLKKLYNKHSDSIYSVADKPGYFISLEPLPGAIGMIQAATQLLGKKPHVLTAPMQRNPNCEEEKRAWIDSHVGDLIDEFHCTKEKQNFANSEWDILIDDRPKYVNKFRAAGGTAIMHKGDPAATIAKLEETIAKLKGMNEVSAISAGGASLQPSGQISGTGGNPLGRDMSDEHKRMWSGDEPGSDRVDEEFIGTRGGVSYFQMGGSLPDKFYNRTRDGKPTRDPGVGGLKKSSRKRGKMKKSKEDEKKGKRWYEKESVNEMVHEGVGVSYEILRQNRSRHLEARRQATGKARSGQERGQGRLGWIDALFEGPILDVDRYRKDYSQGVEGEFNSIVEPVFYGTNKELAQGDYIHSTPEETLHFTLDERIARMHAKQMAESAGDGHPRIYLVQPVGEIEWVNKAPKATVLSSPTIKILEEL